MRKFWKKKEKPSATTEPKKWSANTAIVVSNNRTGEQLRFESENDYGLTWTYVDILMVIKQKLDLDGGWRAVAHMRDYSMIKIEREEMTEKGS